MAAALICYCGRMTASAKTMGPMAAGRRCGAFCETKWRWLRFCERLDAARAARRRKGGHGVGWKLFPLTGERVSRELMEYAACERRTLAGEKPCPS